jgi:hypothetical protein
MVTYPESIFAKNINGDLPLHLAAANNPNAQVINMLISAFPEGLTMKTNAGHLPIHLAVGVNASAEVTNVLLSAYPEGISIQDNKGNLPIHLAIVKHASAKVVMLLLLAYPNGIAVTNNYGYLPLHIECENLCRSSVILTCIQCYPAALTISTNNSRHVPWTLVIRNMTSENVYELYKSLFLLLSSHPASFYHPPHDPEVDKLLLMQDPLCLRIILNLLPSCLSSVAHVQSYHDLNWQPRCSMLQLLVQIRLNSMQMYTIATSLE